MKKRYLAGIVAAAISLPGAAPAGAAPAASSGGSPAAHIACTYASIGGARKCIARGQFCARAHVRDYRRYGLSCTFRDRNGRYHLK